MKVVTPNTTHTITLIPRFYPCNEVVVSLYNEVDRTTSTPDNTYYINNGTMNVSFDYTFVNKDKFQLKITEGDDVVFRGKIICTDQDTQEFKLTDGIYRYE